MKITNIALFISTFILINSCSNTKNATGNSKTLTQYYWKLTEVQQQKVPVSSKAHLLFSDLQGNVVTGSNGCNRLNGDFKLSESNSINFSNFSATRMACIDNTTQEIETKFLEVLGKTNKWNIHNKTLELKSDTLTMAKFSALEILTKEQEKLNGSWELNYISGPRIAFNGLFPNKKPQINFDLPGSEISGNSSCNVFSCKIKLKDNKISFEEAISTKMYCEGNGEATFFTTLKTVTAFSFIDDQTLTLLMKDVPVMRFTKL